MITILPETTKNPLEKMGYMAGVCWNSDVDNTEKNRKRAINCIKSGHHRILEYVDVELIIDGYSARVIREWYTHIAGSPTRLQESTRYVNSRNFNYSVPDNLTPQMQVEFIQAMENTRNAYTNLVALGMAKEDAAMILPLGMSTKIVDKRNLRNLIEMSHQRLCKRAYWEYQKLMKEIMEALRNYSDEWAYVVDNLFVPKCKVYGRCTEEKGCGK